MEKLNMANQLDNNSSQEYAVGKTGGRQTEAVRSAIRKRAPWLNATLIDDLASIAAAAEVEDRKHFVMGAFATPPANLGVTANTSLAAVEPLPIYKSPANMWRHAMEVTISHTIERCAQVADGFVGTYGGSVLVAAAIRALKDKP